MSESITPKPTPKQDLPTSVLLVNELLEAYKLETELPPEDKAFLIQLVEESLRVGYINGYRDKEQDKKPVITLEMLQNG